MAIEFIRRSISEMYGDGSRACQVYLEKSGHNLKRGALSATLHSMKLLSIKEAQERFAAVCEAALAGEVIRLQLANGALLELTPVPAIPSPPALSDKDLAQCYDDADWAAYENRCAKVND